MALMFGGHRLDVGARQLFRGTEEVRLSPKAFDLLCLLVDNRVRAVSKAEIHDRLWSGTFVTEATLASVVAELRRALKDSPQDPKFIRTVHRFGYGFAAAVTGAPEPAPPDRTCWIIWRGREIALVDGENIIGRDPDAVVRLDFPSVSRRHARITVRPDAVTVEDLGSKNGTRVREKAIAGQAPLVDLDELQVGSVRMTVRILRGGESTQTSEL